MLHVRRQRRPKHGKVESVPLIVLGGHVERRILWRSRLCTTAATRARGQPLRLDPLCLLVLVVKIRELAVLVGRALEVLLGPEKHVLELSRAERPVDVDLFLVSPPVPVPIPVLVVVVTPILAPSVPAVIVIVRHVARPHKARKTDRPRRHHDQSSDHIYIKWRRQSGRRSRRAARALSRCSRRRRRRGRQPQRQRRQAHAALPCRRGRSRRRPVR